MRGEPEPCALRPSWGRFFHGRKDVGVMGDASQQTGEFEAVYRVQGRRYLDGDAASSTKSKPAGALSPEDVPTPPGGRVLEVRDGGDGLYVRVAIPLPVPAAPAAIANLLLGSWTARTCVRILHVELPTGPARHLPGPRYGVPELRRRLAARFRPLLLATIAEPSGGDLDTWAATLRAEWMAGVDILVEAGDQGPADWSRTQRRIDRARREAEALARDAARRPLYAVRLAASGPDFAERVRRLVDAGAEALTVGWTVGDLDALAAVAARPGGPVLLAGARIAAQSSGVLAPSVLFGELARAAGADVSGYAGTGPDGQAAPLSATEQASVGAALAAPTSRRAAWAAPSLGIHPGALPTLVRELGPDIVVDATAAIQDHPGGPRAGAAAFIQAFDRLSGHIGPLPDELAQALARWGGAA